MAVAFITTFYGSFLANLMGIPIGAKLALYSRDEILVRSVMLEGILSIAVGENPRAIEEKLKAYLAPTLRDIQMDDGRQAAPAE
jgi:chemotaxis protein MotA